MNLFSRSAQHLNLTPGERALLKLVEGFVLAGVVAVVPVVAPLLSQQHINWSVVVQVAVPAFVVAFLMAGAKYYKAQGDPALSTVLAEVANDVKQGVALPHG